MITPTVLTIGHSKHSIEKFIGLLRPHSVSAVVDVRSQPYSKFNPDFNREVLARSLPMQGIAYIFLGKELGARSDDPSCYENGTVKYGRLAKTDAFRAGLERVQAENVKQTIALMCAEREPLECHRTLLVARELVNLGTDVVHILADGQVEPHADAMKRLLKLLGWPDQEDLFRTYSQIMDEAYAAQESRVAYVDPELVSEGHPKP